MAISRKEAARALSTDEKELVEKSHHPTLQDLPDDELKALVRHLRERRDKAQTEASRRRREMRGKAAGKGATPSRSDNGSRTKVEVLAMAMRRLNGEVERRERMSARVTMVANAQRALAMKEAVEKGGPDFNSRQAHDGMRNLANKKGENLVRPMELGRQRKAAGIAQAKRDGR
jgi:hypothetical protein